MSLQAVTLVQMHVIDWAEAQKEDLMLSIAVLNWLKAQKKTDLKVFLAGHASSEESRLILWNQQKFSNSSRGLVPVAQCPKVRPKIFYYSWSPGPIVLLP